VEIISADDFTDRFPDFDLAGEDGFMWVRLVDVPSWVSAGSEVTHSLIHSTWVLRSALDASLDAWRVWLRQEMDELDDPVVAQMALAVLRSRAH